MRIFLAITALAGLLASGIGCVASPDGAESESTAQAGEALKSEGLARPSTLRNGCVETVVCIDGKHWDSETCSCVGPVCDPILCVEGKHWDPETCSCVGPVCDPIHCADGKVWDPETCSCECGVEPDHCLAGQQWNEAACGCECIEIVDCIHGKHWDPYTCRCEKPVKSTPGSND